MCCVGLFKINFLWFLFVILGLVILFSHVYPTGEKETKLIRKKPTHCELQQQLFYLMIMTHNGIMFLFNRHKVHVCGYLGEHYCSRVRSSDVELKGLRFLLHTFKLQSVVNAWDHADFPRKSNEPAGAFCADWTHIITTQGISRAWRKGTECCKPSQVLKIHILTFIASFTVRPRLCKSQFLLFYCTGHRPCGWSKSNQFLSRLPVWGNGCRPEMENFKLGIVLMKMCTGFPNPR